MSIKLHRAAYNNRKESSWTREDILNVLIQVIGEEGYGIACEEAAVFKYEEEWKFMLEGFMEPWQHGHTVAEPETISKFTKKFGLLQPALTLENPVELTNLFASSG